MKLVGFAIAAWFAVGALASGDARAETTKPTFISGPTRTQMIEVLPNVIQSGRLSVNVELKCTVGTDGRLRECGVIFAETNKWMKDTRAAVMALTADFHLTPAMRDGAPVERSIKIPIRLDRLNPGWNGKTFEGDEAIPTVTAPDWREPVVIGWNDLPWGAFAKNGSGLVYVTCDVSAAGHPSGCVAEEVRYKDPDSKDTKKEDGEIIERHLDQIVLGLVDRFKLKPAQREGVAVPFRWGSQVRVPSVPVLPQMPQSDHATHAPPQIWP